MLRPGTLHGLLNAAGPRTTAQHARLQRVKHMHVRDRTYGMGSAVSTALPHVSALRYRYAVVPPAELLPMYMQGQNAFVVSGQGSRMCKRCAYRYSAN